MHPTKRINFNDFVEEKRAEGTVIDLPGGDFITIPPAMLWTDATFEAINEDRVDDAVRMILGDADAAKFNDAGGNFRILRGMIEKAKGMEVGESGASSES